MLRVVNGDDIRVDALKRLAAAGADTAGNLLSPALALHGRAQNPRKRMLAGADGPADQIAVCHASAGKRAAQTRLHGIIAQKAGKVHIRCSFLGLYFALYHSITDFPPLRHYFFCIVNA